MKPYQSFVYTLYMYIYIHSYTVRRRGTFSAICIIQPTKRSRWKFRICTYTMIILCIVFLYIYIFVTWRCPTVAEKCRRQHNKVGYKTVVFWRTASPPYTPWKFHTLQILIIGVSEGLSACILMVWILIFYIRIFMGESLRCRTKTMKL